MRGGGDRDRDTMSATMRVSLFDQNVSNGLSLPTQELPKFRILFVLL